MPQSRADSPEAIFDALSGDSTFMSYVGQYTFSANSTPVDSICILTPGEKLPQLKSQTGLEVVIHDVGQVTRFDYLTDQPETLVTWQVFLILWPEATGTTMTMAAKRIVEMFSGTTTIQTVATPGELGAMVQTIALIPENAAILV